jgi:diamine N-acetyltransferase
MKNYYFLKSEHIYMRPFEEGDEAFFTKWYNDKETRGKIGEILPTSKLQAEKIVKREEKDSVWFAIVREDNGAVIGETGLLRMFPAWRTTDLTIIIPDKENQGKGFGTEAITLLMDYAFGYLAYNRISIGVVGFNTQALEFYKKVGFKQEGIQEQGYYYNYKYYDFVMMRILKDEFVKMHNIEL